MALKLITHVAVETDQLIFTGESQSGASPLCVERKSERLRGRVTPEELRSPSVKRHEQHVVCVFHLTVTATAGAQYTPRVRLLWGRHGWNSHWLLHRLIIPAPPDGNHLARVNLIPVSD